MDSSQLDDLCERLRATKRLSEHFGEFNPDIPVVDWVNPDGPEAADTITTLRAEIAEANEALTVAYMAGGYDARKAALKAEAPADAQVEAVARAILGEMAGMPVDDEAWEAAEAAGDEEYKIALRWGRAAIAALSNPSTCPDEVG